MRTLLILASMASSAHALAALPTASQCGLPEADRLNRIIEQSVDQHARDQARKAEAQTRASSHGGNPDIAYHTRIIEEGWRSIIRFLPRDDSFADARANAIECGRVLKAIVVACDERPDTKAVAIEKALRQARVDDQEQLDRQLAAASSDAARERIRRQWDNDEWIREMIYDEIRERMKHYRQIDVGQAKNLLNKYNCSEVVPLVAAEAWRVPSE